ncbi:demethylase [Aureococcus anophagefferens]|nr:demethylase [Aureococcus anophagefferens]
MDLSLVEQSRESFEAMLMGKRCRSPLEVAAVDGADVDGAYCEQQGRDWTLGEWASYFARKKAGAHKVLNVLSLEIGGTRLGDAVAAPRFVRDLDWIDATPADERPKVQKYCLMSAGGSFTDWHVDMGGSSVWYHVVSGEKRFWCAAPTEENLGAYARWISSRDQSATWFGDCVGADQVAYFALGPGMTLSLPSGWLHAVYTPEDSLVFGGNYLHTLAARTQFAIFDVEKACRVDKECRFPRWLETTAAGAAREALRPAAAPAVAAARQALAATLKAWCAGDPAPTHRATRLTDGEAAVLRASLDAAAARVGARDAGELLDAVAGAATLARAHPPSPIRRTLPVTGTPPAAVALVDAEERARFLRGRRDVRRSALIGHDGAALEESEGDDSEDEWTGNDAPRGPPRGRAKRSLYDDDDSDASSDGDGGLVDDGDLGALKAKSAARGQDARERGGQACEDRKKATEEAYFQKARDRAQALSLVDAAPRPSTRPSGSTPRCA